MILGDNTQPLVKGGDQWQTARKLVENSEFRKNPSIS